jgi:predicted anti-sigma-YlaC factor YlaD
LQKYFKEGLDLIKAMEDEARVEAHLGRMDAKGRWAALETELSKAEHQALQEAPVVLDHAIQALRTARSRISKPAANGAASAAPARR